jgi:hypothetical protein
MAVSKRTRFEVLRRDEFACRYCGAMAPDAKLTVDHVVPVALGGSDDPANLVAACRDCNAGKGSTGPSEELVQDVSDDARRWAAAIQQVALDRAVARDMAELRVHRFYEEWKSWDATLYHLPSDWRTAVNGWLDAGLTMDEVVESLSIALSNRGVRHDGVFAYTCGVVRNKIKALHEAARALLEKGDA